MSLTGPKLQTERVGMAHCLAMRPYLNDATPIREARHRAVGFFRDHRFRLGFSDIAGSTPQVVADNSSGQQDLKKVASRIHGLEIDAWQQGTSQDGHSTRLAAQIFRGAEEIQGAYDAIATELYTVNEALRGRNLINKAFMTFLATVAIYLISSDPSLSLGKDIALALGCNLDGFSFYLISRDHHAELPIQLNDGLIQDGGWYYAAHDYQLIPAFLDGLTASWFSPFKLESAMRKQDEESFVQKGVFGKIYARLFNRPLAWVGVDKLFCWDDETKEPVMALSLRLSLRRPKYPQTVLERSNQNNLVQAENHNSS